DLIIELGRGYGNSTCCFLEVCRHLKDVNGCKLISLCFGDDWEKLTWPKVEKIVGRDWAAPGSILRQDILQFDFAAAVRHAKRVAVLWDAHGFAIAECVLGKLMPAIAPKPHVVLMHDLCDTRYDGAFSGDYGGGGVWSQDDSATNNYLHLGHICTSVPQAISAIDFTTRNRVP